MKTDTTGISKNAAFTIVELLTVMSIITILIGLLVPALNKVKRYSYEVKQKAQLKGIETGLEFFNAEFGDYPDSGPFDPIGVPYCGAMKLCEAMMGWDLMGIHQDSVFRSDGMDGTGKVLYPNENIAATEACKDSLCIRKGPYLALEGADAFAIGGLYSDSGPFSPRNLVLCDVFKRAPHSKTGRKVGMPILYYKANARNTKHNVDNPNDPDNIYNYRDNQELVALGKPWEPASLANFSHRLLTVNEQGALRFYLNTKNYKVTTVSRPYRADTYILISAGYDGEYGTPDDICNYEWKYRDTLSHI
jgi:type II secretory pathway pseudopilin PulG